MLWSTRLFLISLAAFILVAGAVPVVGVSYKLSGETSRQGIPVGGVGAGSLEIFPDGTFGNAEFRNNWGQPTQLWGFLFALNVKSGGVSTSRMLNSNGLVSIPGVEQVEFTGEFPTASFNYKDSSLPLEVSAEAFSSFIPGDAKNSALPAFSITFSLHNPGKTPVTAKLVNLVGNYTSEKMTALADTQPQKLSLTSNRSLQGIRLGVKPGYFRKASKKIKVLLISDRAIPWISYALSEVNGFDYEWVTGKSIKLPYDDPASLAVHYDAIWLMEMPNMRQALSHANMVLIRDAVAKGCGFILTGGPNSYGAAGLHGTPIEEICPVNISETSDVKTGAFRRKPTTEYSPLFQNLDFPELREFLGFNKAAGVKPEAKVVIETTDGDPILITSRYKGTPVLAYTSQPWGPWRIPWTTWTAFFQNMVGYVTLNAFSPGGGCPSGNPGYGSFTAGAITESSDKSGVDIQLIDPDRFTKAFEKDGSIGPDPGIVVFQTWALSRTVEIKPGETLRLPFVYSWYFPNHYDEDFVLVGNQYANWFGDSLDVAKYFGDNYEKLEKNTRLWHDTVYKGNLSDWVSDATANSLSALIKSTWWTADGRFGMLESHDKPVLNSMDSIYYGSAPLSAMFPQLEKNMLQQIAAAQGSGGTPAGYIPENMGLRSLNSPVAASNGVLRKDLIPKFTLVVYRDYMWTGDTAFLKANWNVIKQGTDWLATTDKNGDGLPDHEGGDTCYSAWKYEGASSYGGSLWLAHLAAVKRMAEITGDTSYAKKSEDLFGKASKSFDSLLWNGRYYMASKGSLPTPDSCFIEQTAGQWYTNLLGIGDLFSRERNAAVVTALLERCARPRGFVTATLTDGKPDPTAMGQSDVISPAVAYAAAANLLSTEKPIEGRHSTPNVEKILQAAGKMHNYMASSIRVLWNQPRSYSPDSGGVFGSYYTGAMSVWSVPMAAMGLNYDALDKRVYLMPKVKIGELTVPYAFAGNSGVVAQISDTEVEIQAASGELPVQIVDIGNQWIDPSGIAAKLNDKWIECKMGMRDGRIMAVFTRSLKLKAGDKLYLIVI